MNKDTIIGTVPAASELHKVQGFDPLKYLRKAVNAQGENVMRLDLRFQKLWFRLACPKGRMLLNPLRITDQLAIFEAKVFFHRDDPAPASSFTANKTAQETRDYIRAAQEEALEEALDNAGFGIQLCDVTQASDSKVGLDGPAVQPVSVSEQKVDMPAAVSLPIRKEPEPIRKEDAAPAPVKETAAEEAAVEAPPKEQPKVQASPAVEDPAPVAQPTVQEYQEVEPDETEPDTLPQEAPSDEAAPGDDQQSLLKVLNFPSPAREAAVPQDTVAVAVVEEKEEASQAAPSYTEDMSVDEILAVMTMEDAQAIVVPRGPCAGWTMAQVAKQRPSSLRFFLTSFCECSNAQKAAATLLIQDLERNKAG